MTTFGGVSGNRLRQFIEQIEYLEEQKAGIAADTREVFSEAKSAGFDVKVIRQILKIRKMDQDELSEQEAILETYMQALKMTSATSTKTDDSSDHEAHNNDSDINDDGSHLQEAI